MKSKPENMLGGLWLTTMGRIVVDDHGSEVFCEPYDRKLMTKEELSRGIQFTEFMKRVANLTDNKSKANKK